MKRKHRQDLYRSLCRSLRQDLLGKLRRNFYTTLFSLALLTTTLLSWAPQAHAVFDNRFFGAGIVLGAPTALTAKYWLNSEQAVDGQFSYVSGEYFLIYGDYLLHYPGLIKSHEPFLKELAPYIGLGGIIAMTTNDRSDDDYYLGKHTGSIGLGVRVPVGVEWRPMDPSIGVFIEIAPGISILPQTTAIVQAGIGIRYYF